MEGVYKIMLQSKYIEWLPNYVFLEKFSIEVTYVTSLEKDLYISFAKKQNIKWKTCFLKSLFKKIIIRVIHTKHDTTRE
jgi:hypothetical protein